MKIIYCLCFISLLITTSSCVKKKDEQPAVLVDVAGFMISKYEVTQHLYQSITNTNPSKEKSCSKCPVTNVSYNDAINFISKLNELEPGSKFRLPTEVEWEYAASANQDFEYSGSPSLRSVAIFKGNSRGKPNEVGQKDPNGFKIYDMTGNVAEWCSDWYNENAYKNIGVAQKGSEKVVRGGSWRDKDSYCRINKRDSEKPNKRRSNIGFRLVKEM